HYMRNAKRTFPDDPKQTFFQSIGLRLHTVHQYTPNIIATYTTALKDMAWRSIAAFARICGRKYLVSFSADWLETLTPAQGGVFGNHLSECGSVHRFSFFHPAKCGLWYRPEVLIVIIGKK
ncbi:MAG: hypothetical protein WBQ94_25240, partial [Terracidiphilus sp.]